MNGSTKVSWFDFLKIPRSHFPIAFYLVHHGNKATKKELIEVLSNFGERPDTTERIIRDMKQHHILCENGNGQLSLTNPLRYRFVIKIIRGNVLDRWIMLSLPLATLLLMFTFLDIRFAQVFALIMLAFIVIWIIDDLLHIVKP